MEDLPQCTAPNFHVPVYTGIYRYIGIYRIPLCTALIIGHGDVTNGLKNTWRGVRKFSEVASSINPSRLHQRMFNTSVHPAGKDVDPEQEGEAPSDGLHGLESTAAPLSM
jgi:hypothetical protein